MKALRLQEVILLFLKNKNTTQISCLYHLFYGYQIKHIFLSFQSNPD
jgi:hypothetical protein